MGAGGWETGRMGDRAGDKRMEFPRASVASVVGRHVRGDSRNGTRYGDLRQVWIGTMVRRYSVKADYRAYPCVFVHFAVAAATVTLPVSISGPKIDALFSLVPQIKLRSSRIYVTLGYRVS